MVSLVQDFKQDLGRGRIVIVKGTQHTQVKPGDDLQTELSMIDCSTVSKYFPTNGEEILSVFVYRIFLVTVAQITSLKIV